MFTTRRYLAEETRFHPTSDESIRDIRHSDPETADWSSDPMEILMMKQELERLELEAELAQRH